MATSIEQVFHCVSAAPRPSPYEIRNLLLLHTETLLIMSYYTRTVRKRKVISYDVILMMNLKKNTRFWKWKKQNISTDNLNYWSETKEWFQSETSISSQTQFKRGLTTLDWLLADREFSQDLTLQKVISARRRWFGFLQLQRDNSRSISNRKKYKCFLKQVFVSIQSVECFAVKLTFHWSRDELRTPLHSSSVESFRSNGHENVSHWFSVLALQRFYRNLSTPLNSNLFPSWDERWQAILIWF